MEENKENKQPQNIPNEEIQTAGRPSVGFGKQKPVTNKKFIRYILLSGLSLVSIIAIPYLIALTPAGQGLGMVFILMIYLVTGVPILIALTVLFLFLAIRSKRRSNSTEITQTINSKTKSGTSSKYINGLTFGLVLFGIFVIIEAVSNVPSDPMSRLLMTTAAETFLIFFSISIAFYFYKKVSAIDHKKGLIYLATLFISYFIIAYGLHLLIIWQLSANYTVVSSIFLSLDSTLPLSVVLWFIVSIVAFFSNKGKQVILSHSVEQPVLINTNQPVVVTSNVASQGVSDSLVNVDSAEISKKKVTFRTFFTKKRIIVLAILIGAIYLMYNVVSFLAPNLVYYPKNENQILSQLQSISDGKIKSISNFKASPSYANMSPGYLVGYAYEGFYHIDGLKAGIYFSDLENNGSSKDNYDISSFLNPYSLSSSNTDAVAPTDKYFTQTQAFSGYFTDKSWKSFEDYYNQTGQKELGLIARFTFGSSLTKSGAINDNTIIIGHPYKDIVVVYPTHSCIGGTSCQASIIYYDNSSNAWKLISNDYLKYIKYYDTQYQTTGSINTINWDAASVNANSTTYVNHLSGSVKNGNNSLSINIGSSLTSKANPIKISGIAKSSTPISSVKLVDESGASYNALSDDFGKTEVNWYCYFSFTQQGKYSFTAEMFDSSGQKIKASADGSDPGINFQFPS
jgi:hypothetical protein